MFGLVDSEDHKHKHVRERALLIDVNVNDKNRLLIWAVSILYLYCRNSVSILSSCENNLTPFIEVLMFLHQFKCLQ